MLHSRITPPLIQKSLSYLLLQQVCVSCVKSKSLFTDANNGGLLGYYKLVNCGAHEVAITDTLTTLVV